MVNGTEYVVGVTSLSELASAAGGGTGDDGAGGGMTGEDAASCSCLEGNPCGSPYNCKDWANREEVARRHREERAKGPFSSLST
eukprot:g5668.t1